jgi:hypothetical protein
VAPCEENSSRECKSEGFTTGVGAETTNWEGSGWCDREQCQNPLVTDAPSFLFFLSITCATKLPLLNAAALPSSKVTVTDSTAFPSFFHMPS